MSSLPVGCSSFAFVMFTAPIVYCALLPTTRHLDRAAAAATQWLGAGEGRRELLASFCRQPDVCARCVLCLSGAKAPACFEIPERDLAAVLGSVLGQGSKSSLAETGVENNEPNPMDMFKGVDQDAIAGFLKNPAVWSMARKVLALSILVL